MSSYSNTAVSSPVSSESSLPASPPLVPVLIRPGVIDHVDLHDTLPSDYDSYVAWLGGYQIAGAVAWATGFLCGSEVALATSHAYQAAYARRMWPEDAPVGSDRHVAMWFRRKYVYFPHIQFPFLVNFVFRRRDVPPPPC
jgi:hypothetical protein